MEQDNEEVSALNDFMERTIGRKPISLREWLMEHKREMLGLNQGAATTAAASDAEIRDCTVATPVGKVPYKWVVRCAEDNTWTSTMKALKSGADMPVRRGRISGNVLSSGSELTKPFKLKLKIEVEIRGKELSGHASASLVGKSAMVGTRRA